MANSLTTDQADLLAQLQSITNSSDMDGDSRILEAANWDLQRAVQMIYDEDASPSHPQASSSRNPVGSGQSARLQPLEVDDSLVPAAFDQPARHRPVSTAYPNTWTLGLSLVNIFTLPISVSVGLLSNLLQFILRLLRLPIPRFLRTSSAAYTSLRGPPAIDDPMLAADRLVRQLEEETGAVCVSRLGLTQQGSREAALSFDADDAEKRKILPDFWIGSYKTALETAKKDIRILCVILMSEEHQDMPHFRKTVLTDPELVRVLTDNAILTWAGDIRDREAYEVAQSLQATTYPFVAFIALQSRGSRITSSSSSPGVPRLAVLSRHEGSPLSATSANTLQAYITSTLIPRTAPLLARLRNEQRTRQAERLLREEQDRAFREAEKRDRERLEKRRAEERARVDAEEQRKRLEEEAEQQAKRRDHWRRWARKALVPPDNKDGVRIGVRLPDGKRLVRNFSPEATLEQLYAFIDVQSLGDGHAELVDTDVPPPDFTPDWNFQLAATYPRIEIPFVKDTRLRDIPALRNGANLIAEVMRNGQIAGQEPTDSEEDDE